MAGISIAERERRRELEALPARNSGFEWRDLGETYRQAWERMNPEERHTMLLDSGIRVTVAGGLGNEFFGHFYVPDDILGKIEAR